MINDQLYYNVIHQKMMNKALTMIAEEAFFNALPYSFVELSASEKQGLHEYVTTAIENFGGAKVLLESAINRNEANYPRKRYMTNMYNICRGIATEATDRIVKEKKKDSDFSSSVQDANFTEEEFRKFESNAENLELEEVGKIISEKVVATIKGEQEAFANEKMIDDKIWEMISEQSESDNDEETKKGVESFYNITLKNQNPRHNVSFFSKLVDAATEAATSLYPTVDGLCIPAIKDVTFLYSIDSYKQSMSATEALDRLVSTDMCMINDNAFSQAATEALNNGTCIKNGFVAGATVYTFMETMKTLNLVSPSKREIDKFINTTNTPSSYVNCAVESFVKKFGELTRNAEDKIRSLNTTEALLDYKKYFDGLYEKVNSVCITSEASEAFTKCQESVNRRISSIYEKIDQTCVLLSKLKPQMTAAESAIRERDMAQMNRQFTVYGKRPDVTEFTIQAPKNAPVLKLYGKDVNGQRVVNTFLYVEGIQNKPVTVIESYVKSLVSDIKEGLCAKKINIVID